MTYKESFHLAVLQLVNQDPSIRKFTNREGPKQRELPFSLAWVMFPSQWVKPESASLHVLSKQTKHEHTQTNCASGKSCKHSDIEFHSIHPYFLIMERGKS